MSIDKMSKSQEDGLVDSVMQAIRLSNEGMHPNEAIVKVASDKGYNQNFVQRMVEAFNTSKAIKHRKEASGEAKADTFVIADLDVILKKLYPENVETPAEIKTGAWEPAGMIMSDERHFDLENAPTVSQRTEDSRTWEHKDGNMLVKQACAELYRQERIVADLRDKMAASREQLVTGINKLADYFRLNVHEPFEKVESAALNHFGDRVKPLMSMVYSLSKRAQFREKRASAPAKVKYTDRTPYVLVDETMTVCDTYVKCATVYAKAARALSSYHKGLHERLQLFSKASSGMGAFVGGMMMPKAITDMTKTRVPESEANDVTSVEFDAERKGIQTKLMLHDFLNNDEVLSKAEPQRVVSAFNEISSLAPRAAMSPMVMRGLLRKAIEANVHDPYELANLVNIETGLKKRDDQPGEPSV